MVQSHSVILPVSLNELGCAVIALSMGTLSLFALDWKGLVNWLVK